VIGGHVDAATLQAGLAALDPRLEGFIQTGDIKAKLHYRFAGELLLGALAHSMNAMGRVDLEAIVREAAEVLAHTWTILDDLIACYAAERRLS
jgi:hypothetical protein